MREFKDLTGTKSGYLTILGLKQNGKTRRSWSCVCDCGKKLVLAESWLVRTKGRRPNKSCGCMQLTQNGYSMSEPKLFAVWHNMINRCHNPKFNIYYKYGAKGTTVCDEWRNDFETFMEWSKANGYEEGLTIDRIDNEKGYEPSNCRWTTHNVQARNKGIRSTNKSGTTGVCSHEKGGYRAYIQRDGIDKHIGVFKDLQDAINARKREEQYYKNHGKLSI